VDSAHPQASADFSSGGLENSESVIRRAEPSPPQPDPTVGTEMRRLFTAVRSADSDTNFGKRLDLVIESTSPLA